MIRQNHVQPIKYARIQQRVLRVPLVLRVQKMRRLYVRQKRVRMAVQRAQQVNLV
jgi:hypothetical protein